MSFPFTGPPPAEKLRPLRIHHFLLWMSVSAVMLTVFKAESTSSTSFSPSMDASSIPSTLVYTLCLTGLLLGLYWKRQGHFFFDEPGQMAYILHGISAVHMLFSASIPRFLEANSAEPAVNSLLVPIVLGIGSLIIAIVQLVLYFRFAHKFSYAGNWGRFFYAVGILTLLQYIIYFFVPVVMFAALHPDNIKSFFVAQFVIHLIFSGIELLYWIQSVRHDVREKVEYHWTHWLGASTWPALQLIGIGSWILMLFYYSSGGLDGLGG